MLEILLLVRLTRSLASTAKEKARSGWWGGLLPLFWIVGEIAGAIMAALVLGVDGFALYGVGLLCAGAGALAAFGIVWALPDASPAHEWAGDPAPYENRHFDPTNPYSPPERDRR